MFKIKVDIEADGDKKAIYELKEEVLQLAARHSCQIRCDLTNQQGFQESVSASFASIVDVNPDDIVDLTLTGDEQFELLIHKETEKME